MTMLENKVLHSLSEKVHKIRTPVPNISRVFSGKKGKRR